MKSVQVRDVDGNIHDGVTIDQLKWRPSIYGVCIKDESVLLVPQWDGYDFPGGGMDLGEDLNEALLRECKEETGLTVEEKEVIHLQSDFFYHSYDKQHYQSILMYYRVEYVSGEFSTEGFDEHEQEYAQQAQWVPLSEIENIKFYNPVDSVAIIRKAFEKRSQ